jgi:tRNA U55 pseudouridine synthase TruB
MPADRALQHWPERRIGAEAARRFTAGQAVSVAGTGAVARTGSVRVYEGANGFLGVGELTGDGMLTPRRIFRAAT